MPGIAGNHRQISKDWHMLTTEDGIFFGYTESQVREKAAVAARDRALARAAALKMLPLLEKQVIA